MSKYKKTFRSLELQYQVLKALILREVLTRWGRKNIGVVWLIAEPITMMLFYTAFWYFKGEWSNVLWMRFGIPVLSFVFIGHAAYLVWANAVSLGKNAIRSNSALLHHRNLKPLDFYLARIILEITSTSGAYLLLFFLLILFNLIPEPKDIPLMLGAWLLLSWFSLGAGLTIGSILSQYEFLTLPWRLISLFLFLSSGVFFFAAFLPPNLLKYAIWLPTLEINEMFKHGYYGNIIKTYEDPLYLCVVNTVLLSLGLLLVAHFGKKLPQRL
jgi:capsular polysaccharide transport system permease protein